MMFTIILTVYVMHGIKFEIQCRNIIQVMLNRIYYNAKNFEHSYLNDSTLLHNYMQLGYIHVALSLYSLSSHCLLSRAEVIILTIPYIILFRIRISCNSSALYAAIPLHYSQDHCQNNPGAQNDTLLQSMTILLE